MELKELMTKEFFIYIFFKLLSICFITISLFSIFFRKEKNIFLGGLLFVIGFIFLILTSLIEKPKLATCLDKCGFFKSLFIKTSLFVGVSLLALSIAFGFDGLIILSSILLFGIFSYFFCCKRNMILD